MRFASLGSGSAGNAWIIEGRTPHGTPTRIMVDCGFTLKETIHRLNRIDLEPHDLACIVVTHEHDDHIAGVFKLARRFKIPVWLTAGTWRAVRRSQKLDDGWLEQGHARIFDSHSPWSVGDVLLEPFPVPHDALEPAQMVLGDGHHRLGLMTDCGMATPHVIHMLSGCDALVLESNHDSQLLSASVYPHSLKRRISSDYGHLSNDAACEILRCIDKSRLKALVAAHLSETTNTPERVQQAWESALGGFDVRFAMANQQEGLVWHTL